MLQMFSFFRLLCFYSLCSVFLKTRSQTHSLPLSPNSLLLNIQGMSVLGSRVATLAAVFCYTYPVTLPLSLSLSAVTPFPRTVIIGHIN